MKSVKCLAAGKRVCNTQKRKTVSLKRTEIKIVSANKHPLIVSIPMIVGLTVVVVKIGLAVLVPIHVEHLRIAIGVCYCIERRLNHCPCKSLKATDIRLNLIRHLKCPSVLYQVSCFF